MLRKIYEIIEPSDNDSSMLLKIYDIIMLTCIVASMIPIAVKSNAIVFAIIDKITVSVFILDYILRLITAKYKLQKGVKSFFIYPFCPMAIIDLISILPSLVPINNMFKALRLLRLARTLRALRSLKVFRYSKNIDRIVNVLKKETKPLITVMSLAMFYVLFTALIMFNIEPESFNNFFDAIYWATISLTSIGYGDIAPVSTMGRLFTILSAFVGIAIIALPSGIITAGYIEVLNEEKSENNIDK